MHSLPLLSSSSSNSLVYKEMLLSWRLKSAFVDYAAQQSCCTSLGCCSFMVDKAHTTCLNHGRLSSVMGWTCPLYNHLLSKNSLQSKPQFRKWFYM